jgi:hypothetical protein
MITIDGKEVVRETCGPVERSLSCRRTIPCASGNRMMVAWRCSNREGRIVDEVAILESAGFAPVKGGELHWGLFFGALTSFAGLLCGLGIDYVKEVYVKNDSERRRLFIEDREILMETLSSTYDLLTIDGLRKCNETIKVARDSCKTQRVRIILTELMDEVQRLPNDENINHKFAMAVSKAKSRL